VGIAHHRGLDWAQLVGDAHPTKAELIIIVVTLNLKLNFVNRQKHKKQANSANCGRRYGQN